MTQFNRQKVEELLKSDTVTIAAERGGWGGDWDLVGMRVTARGAALNEHINIVPFLDPNGSTADTVDQNNCDVHALEVQCSGCDGRGGCQTSDILTSTAYGAILGKLHGAGFRTIGHHDEIF